MALKVTYISLDAKQKDIHHLTQALSHLPLTRDACWNEPLYILYEKKFHFNISTVL